MITIQRTLNMATSKKQQRSAKHGEKMIEVKVRFWTDKLAETNGEIVPKHAWAAGVVRMERNEAHGIKPGTPIPFNSLLDVGAAIEKAFIEHDIRLVPSRKMRRYFAE